ncbi:MAG: RNA polymerase sigma factor [Deltaproteobacteria bacterium]
MGDTGFLKKLLGVLTGAKRKYSGGGASDEKLIELFLSRRDEEAFEEVVSRYVDKVYGLALRITRNPDAAEEIVQEVFLTLVTKLDTFRGEAKFSSWLYRVTANAGYMHIRAGKKRDGDLSLDDYTSYDGDGTLMGRVQAKDWSSKPDTLLLGREATEIIERAIGELPEPYRIVFHLRDIEGLTNEETSKVLELSVAAVKTRLHRARLFLRDKISDYFHEWGAR